MQIPPEINGLLDMIGYTIVTTVPTLGVAWISASVINGTAHQPEARSAMMSTAFIGFAVVEALAVIVIALAFVLQRESTWPP